MEQTVQFPPIVFNSKVESKRLSYSSQKESAEEIILLIKSLREVEFSEFHILKNVYFIFC